MIPPDKSLGFLRPMGGGDPIPLLKDEILIGRRPTCEVRLDFENVSGRHAQLKFIHGVWHVRDLGSTNGTFINGAKISHDQSVMPNDELGLATHVFWIDYQPVSHGALLEVNQVLEEELGEAGKRKSLMELAGLEGVDRKARNARPTQPVAPIERPDAADAEFEDVVPESFAAGKELKEKSDEDFLDLIRDDLDEEKP